MVKLAPNNFNWTETGRKNPNLVVHGLMTIFTSPGDTLKRICQPPRHLAHAWPRPWSSKPSRTALWPSVRGVVEPRVPDSTQERLPLMQHLIWNCWSRSAIVFISSLHTTDFFVPAPVPRKMSKNAKERVGHTSQCT